MLEASSTDSAIEHEFEFGVCTPCTQYTSILMCKWRNGATGRKPEARGVPDSELVLPSVSRAALELTKLEISAIMVCKGKHTYYVFRRMPLRPVAMC